MALSRILRWIITLIVAFYVLKFMGMTPADLWHAILDRYKAFHEDTVKLTSGQAKDQLSNAWRTEVKAMKPPEVVENDAVTKELGAELQAERARIMEAKLNALKNANLTPVEEGKLKEQVIKNAQMAGGGN